jgi:hypothetical protein
MYKYVLVGDGCRAKAIHSPMNFLEIQEYISNNSIKLSEDGDDMAFYFGSLEFINPRILAVDDFINYNNPYILV